LEHKFTQNMSRNPQIVQIIYQIEVHK